jgi:hypothetical protein
VTHRLIEAILDLALAAVGIMLLTGWIRMRRASYSNIRSSEIDDNVAAGEELLRDVLSERHRVGTLGTGTDVG